MATVREIYDSGYREGYAEGIADAIRFVATVKGWTEKQVVQYYRDYCESTENSVDPNIKRLLYDMQL